MENTEKTPKISPGTVRLKPYQGSRVNSVFSVVKYFATVTRLTYQRV